MLRKKFLLKIIQMKAFYLGMLNGGEIFIFLNLGNRVSQM